MSSLTAERVVEHVTALVKDHSSPSVDPTEILQAALDLCRSAASLLEQDLESREPPTHQATTQDSGSSSSHGGVLVHVKLPPRPGPGSGPGAGEQWALTRGHRFL